MEGKEKCNGRRRTSVVAGILLIAIAFAFIAITPAMAEEAGVTVTVNAPDHVDVEEDTFVVTIDVGSVTESNSAQFDLSFDPDVIEVSDVEEGEINGEEMPISMWVLNPDKDTVRVIINMPVEESVSGTGYLAKIAFKVKGKEGERSVLNISNGKLGKYIKGDTWTPEEIPANWIDAEIIIGVEEEDEEEVGEEVIPGSPNITVWEPAEAVVSNAVGEPRPFNVTVNQIVDISWQINGTEVQTNESTREAVFTNASAVIGTWNVSAIATNTTTGLSDMHSWIWSVTLTVTETVTPTHTLAPGVTPAPEAEAENEVTPTPQGKKAAPKEKTAPAPTPTPTPKPAVPGFEAVFAVAVMTLFLFYKKKTCAKRKKGGKRRKEEERMDKKRIC